MKVPLLLGTALAGLILCSTSQFVTAQSVYGSVKGTLTDVSGKPIGSATVTITSVGKGTKFGTVSDASGFYTVNDVPPDDYSLKIEAGGFKTLQNPLVTVYADNTSQVNSKLVPGSAAEVVTGSAADVSILKIDRTDVATILSRSQITDLPLPEQNVSNLIKLAPGAIPVTPVLSRAQNPQQGTYININGQIFSGTAYQLDGTDNRDALEGIVVVNPNQESVGEMKITTSNYGAEFGEATAGVVTVQTKSGSNGLHGSLFGYSQSAVGEASSPDLVTTPAPGVIVSPLTSHVTLRRNQFGGSIGGPIVKDRLFFFGDYRGTRDASGATLLLTVPTKAVHDNCDISLSSTCNLSEYFNGTSTPAIPTQATAFLLGLLPEPNVGSLTNNSLLTNNYRARGLEPLNSDDSDLRLDYDSSKRLKLFARYSYDSFRQDGSPAFLNAGGPGTNPDNFAGHGRTYNQSGSAGFAYSFGPNLLTDFRFGYLRYHLDLNAPDFGTFPVSSIPNLAGLNDSLYASSLPDIQLDNFFIPSMASVLSPAAPPTTSDQSSGGNWLLRYGYSSAVNNCNCPLREREQQFQWVNNWTRLAGHHSIRWGGDFRYIQNYRFDSANSRSGNLEFGVSGNGDEPVNSSLYNFITGQLSFFNRTYTNPGNPIALNAAERQKRAFFYGEDTWRVSSRLTLTYGLRWEVYFPQYVNQAGAGGFLLVQNNVLPPITSATINVAGTPGVNLQGNVQNTFKNFGPRIGFAYLAGARTVIRGGYGRSFDVGYSGSLFGIAATQNPPVSALIINRNGCFVGTSGTPGSQPCLNFYSLPSPFSTPTGSFTVHDLCANIPANINNAGNAPNCDLATAGSGPTFATALNALPSTLRVPTVDAWNFTVQHQLSPNMYFEVAYVGNKGTHVLTDPSPSAVGGPISLAAASFYNLNQPTIPAILHGSNPGTGVGFVTDAGLPCRQIAPNAGPLSSYCLEKEFVRTPLAPWNQPVNYFGNNASNNYNSLQVKFNKRFNTGYSVLASYVYSKVLDYDSNYFAIDPGIGYGPGSFDRRHNFTMANVWNLPIGRGRPLLRDIGRAADAVIGGWSIQALTSWYSGLPFTPQYSNCPADFNDQGVNIPPCRPNRVGSVSTSGNRNNYYTTTGGTALPVFGPGGCGFVLDSSGNPQPAPGAPIGPWQRPGCGQIGNAGRNSLRGPQFFQSDLAIMKEFSITEHVALRLRADAFNAFNKVNLGQPYPIVDSTQAGTISSSASGAFQRQFEFSAKLQF